MCIRDRVKTTAVWASTLFGMTLVNCDILRCRCQPGRPAIDGDQHAADSLDLREALHNALHMLMVNLEKECEDGLRKLASCPGISSFAMHKVTKKQICRELSQ
eukprot:3182385-Amphidinium_carterae.2